MKTKLLLYCTKAKPSLNLWKAIGIKENVYKAICEYTEMQVDEDLDDFMNIEFVEKYPQYLGERIIFRPTNLNGKIPIECECEVEEIECRGSYGNYEGLELNEYYTDTMEDGKLFKKSCLKLKDLNNYLDNGKKVGYALHLSNIKAFEKPLELKEVYTKYDQHDYSPVYYMRITRAPQNMMRVWYNGEMYVLISIRPEWLCKIANGEKTIEVRRKILKGMM